jgi:hypothetical protein
VNRGALVAVEIDEGRRVLGALALQVEGFLRVVVEERDERVDALERVVVHHPALGDDVVSAAGGAVEEVDEVVALAVDALVGVDAVVGDEDEGGLFGERRAADGRPDAADEGVEFAQRDEV